MNPEWIETLSKKSAYKYRNTSHYDDLISEGVLAAYEEYNLNPSVTEQRLYQVINWAQWKFLNVDSLPVHMPEKLVRMAKGMGSDDVETNYTEENLEWAKVILAQGQFRSEYHDTDHTSNQEEELSKEDLVEKIWEAAQECLTDEDYSLFYAHFELGLDGKSLGDMVGVSKQAMSKKFKAVSQNVKKHIVNKKWEL